MAIVTPPVLVAETDVTSASTIDLVMSQDIPQSTPTVSRVIYLFTKSAGGAGYTVTDNSTQPETPYGAGNQQLSGAGFGGATTNPYGILKPLLAGDKITLDFGSPLDWIHAVAILVEGMWTGGDCVGMGVPGQIEESGDGGSVGYVGGGVWTFPVTLPDATGELGLYMLFQDDDPASDLAWNDGAIDLLTSWASLGPDGDFARIGWRALSGAGPYDPGGSTDDPPVADSVGWVAVWLAPGVGPAYCTVAGNPCFNKLIPV